MKINYVNLQERTNSLFEKKFYDLIIIGSGPAAVTLSEKILSKKKKSKILILEYGDYQIKSYKKILSKYLKIKLKSRVFTSWRDFKYMG
jgi:choline dehydrogenase-like flavoprotein